MSATILEPIVDPLALDQDPLFSFQPPIVPPALQPADLVGVSFNVLPGVFPNVVDAGGLFNINYKFQNSGDLAAGTFKVKFYLSSDTLVDSSDLLLDTVIIDGLSGKTIGVNNSLNLKLPPATSSFWAGGTTGKYHILMAIDTDNQVIESNEANNSSVGLEIDYDNIDVVFPKPNLQGSFFDVKSTALKAGDKFNFDFKIDNLGGATNGTFEVSFYLSSDSIITTADRFITKSTISALAANGTSGPLKLVLDQTLPGIDDAFWTGDGNYTIGMIVDSGNVIAESNEFDNSNRGLALDKDTVFISNTRQANLRGKFFDAKPEPLKAGDKFNFEFEIENLGGATNSNFEVSFYLSTDAKIGTSDFLLTKATVNALLANSTSGRLTMPADITLPGLNSPIWSGDGTYYIGMIVDSGNTIAESNELDNSNRGQGLDLDSVVISNTSLLGTRGIDDISGTFGDDILYGRRGDDDISGLAGNDTLYGERGDDNLYGGLGNDKLYGGEGDDYLYGIDFNSTLSATNSGAGEIDVLNGGSGNDTFFLGFSDKAFYTASGAGDYALIEDFNSTDDTIVLNGSAGSYRVLQTTGSLPSGLGIYRSTELIAIVQGSTSLNLSAGYFSYV